MNTYFYCLGKYKCAWTLTLLGVDIVDDYNKNQIVPGQQENMQCFMTSNTSLNWEEASFGN